MSKLPCSARHGLNEIAVQTFGVQFERSGAKFLENLWQEATFNFRLGHKVRVAVVQTFRYVFEYVADSEASYLIVLVRKFGVVC